MGAAPILPRHSLDAPGFTDEVEMPNKAPPAKKAKRFRRAEVPSYLKEEWGLSYSSRTLAKLATVGGGPPMEYDGRRPLYPQDALDEWAARKIGPRVRSTSELREVA